MGHLEKAWWIQARWDDVWLLTYFKEPFLCALLTFSLNTAGYTAEMLAKAIREIYVCEIEPARASGMSRLQVMLRVVLPSSMRRTMPAFSNEVVVMLQSTSLASAAHSLLNVSTSAGCVYSQYDLPFEAYIAAALYLVVLFCLIAVCCQSERYFLAGPGITQTLSPPCNA